jgi:hypothetical protein
VKTIIYRVSAALLVVTVTIAIVWILPQPTVTHDPPRDLPWALPDHRLAEKAYEYLQDGRIRVITHHLPLPGITPDMLVWFYQYLPISTVDLGGTNYPLYHLFHPTEHGRLWVAEAAPDGTPGMAQGATIVREEWFGEFDSRGKARIVEYSNRGFIAVAYAAGIEIGVVEHRFSVAGGETQYEVQATLGSDLPILGPLLNVYIRNRVFTPAMMTQWMRHQVEEVGSLVHFLPQLYRQRGSGTHFTLDMKPAGATRNDFAQGTYAERFAPNSIKH